MTIEIPHLSYSSVSSYERCPRSWYLGKIKQGEEAVAWYTMIGSAVHDAIEIKLKENREPTVEEVFYPLVEHGLTIEPDMSKWKAGGPKDTPVVEDLAEAQVLQCIEAAYKYLEDLDVWEVEYDATGFLPGCEVPIKAFIDIIGEHKKHGPSIVDWKTGSSKPKNNLQLETYDALLETGNYHTVPKVGLWAMLKEGTSRARPVDLSGVDPVALGERYQNALERMRRGIFPYESGFLCKFCFQAPNCKLESGRNERTNFYDTVETDGYLPY